MGFGCLCSESRESAGLLLTGCVLRDGHLVQCSGLVKSSSSPVSRREQDRGVGGMSPVDLTGR